MRLRYPGCALLALFALGTTAHAQIYDNSEVVVNPQASGSQVLLYPDGRHTRVQRALLQPGQADPYAPIHLHMPYPHHTVHKIAKAAAKPKTETAAVTSPPAKQQSEPQPDMLSFGPVPGESAASMVGPEPKSAPVKSAQQPKPQPAKKVAAVQKPVAAPPKPAPQKTQTAKTQPTKPAPAVAAASNSDMGFLSGDMGAATAAPSPPPPAAKPSRTASVEPADLKGMSKRSSIPFPSGAEEPQPEVLDTVKALSSELNNALTNGSARVELEAFGGKANDKSSEARRLSLKRALIVRQLLIDEGVPSERIDVRAMGGASDGALDRVDVFVRA